MANQYQTVATHLDVVLGQEDEANAVAVIPKISLKRFSIQISNFYAALKRCIFNMGNKGVVDSSQRDHSIYYHFIILICTP